MVDEREFKSVCPKPKLNRRPPSCFKG
ncbi:uncharacterized protein G2W53_026199 [Senna tora]|uniref:Uncharacterized protein n=1 Tax=Senna tora TaxID=362788 RepID=A0A834WL09_9FABA|nr:uncharacterized protein G2W53_026199 [Senna tora]